VLKQFESDCYSTVTSETQERIGSINCYELLQDRDREELINMNYCRSEKLQLV